MSEKNIKRRRLEREKLEKLEFEREERARQEKEEIERKKEEEKYVLLSSLNFVTDYHCHCMIKISLNVMDIFYKKN